MNILIYGGCHASAMTRLIDRYGLPHVKATTLTNYSMIKNSEPFPYDEMANYDLVIFSPIVNKAAYNTSFLEDHLDERKIQYIKYPWVQWNGYFPGFQKTAFFGHNPWWNQSLLKEAARHKTFESFEANVVDGSALSDIALSNLEMTSNKLREGEAKGRVDVKIADWIAQNYAERRLLLTPDHACIELYKYMFQQIEGLVGKIVEPSLYFSTTEIQEGLITPILPSVARALGLRFSSGDFSDPVIMSGRLISLREYLRLYFETERITEICITASQTSLKFDDVEIRVDQNETFLAVRKERTLKGHYCYNLISGLRDSIKGRARYFGKDFFIYKSHLVERHVLA